MNLSQPVFKMYTNIFTESTALKVIFNLPAAPKHLGVEDVYFNK